jgi:hypothetical protein
VKANNSPASEALPESCPFAFSAMMVDEAVEQSSLLAHTSSIFAAEEDDIDDLYDSVDSFDPGSNLIKGAYDTQYEEFGGDPTFFLTSARRKSNIIRVRTPPTHRLSVRPNSTRLDPTTQPAVDRHVSRCNDQPPVQNDCNSQTAIKSELCQLLDLGIRRGGVSVHTLRDTHDGSAS